MSDFARARVRFFFFLFSFLFARNLECLKNCRRDISLKFVSHSLRAEITRSLSNMQIGVHVMRHCTEEFRVESLPMKYVTFTVMI